MSSETSTNSLQPWQFFLLAALGCATAVTFIVRERGVSSVVLLAVIMAATALVGVAVLRTVRPLLNPSILRQMALGQRTRAALEQEKNLALRTIKELEFDRAMGKVSEEDFREMSVRLRARAARLIKQLDAGVGYREQIERDVAARLGAPPEPRPNEASACPSCQTINEPAAKFCKECGARL